MVVLLIIAEEEGFCTAGGDEAAPVDDNY